MYTSVYVFHVYIHVHEKVTIIKFLSLLKLASCNSIIRCFNIFIYIQPIYSRLKKQMT